MAKAWTPEGLVLRPAKVDIVMPAWVGTPELCLLTLASLGALRTHTRHSYRLIYIDNGIRPEFEMMILEELSRHRCVTKIRNPKNIGFVKAINQGLEESSAEYIVLLNNDTQVTDHWLKPLIYALDTELSVQMAGPRTNNLNQWQGRSTYQTKTIPAGMDYIVLRRDLMLAFFCVIFTRKLIDTLGPLDENFGIGLGDDDDYCIRTDRAGFKRAFCPGSLVMHAHRSTFFELYGKDVVHQMQLTAAEKLRDKHHGS